MMTDTLETLAAEITETLTTMQIDDLEQEAGEAGDTDTCELCVAAVDGDEDARVEVGYIIARARMLAA
jgi:hypothetical protein